MLQAGPIALGNDYTKAATFGPFNDAASLEVQIVSESADLQLYRGAHGQENLTGPIIAGPGLYPFSAQARTIGVRAKNHVAGKNASMWARVWFISDPQPGAPVGFGIGSIDPVTGEPIPIDVTIDTSGGPVSVSGTISASPIGTLSELTPADPAPGAVDVLVYTVPALANAGSIVSLTFDYKCGAGSNALVYVVVDDPGGVNRLASPVPLFGSANTGPAFTNHYTYLRGFAQQWDVQLPNTGVTTDEYITNSLLGPGLFFPPGCEFHVIVDSPGGADQISNIALIVEEF